MHVLLARNEDGETRWGGELNYFCILPSMLSMGNFGLICLGFPRFLLNFYVCRHSRGDKDPAVVRNLNRKHTKTPSASQYMGSRRHAPRGNRTQIMDGEIGGCHSFVNLDLC